LDDVLKAAAGDFTSKPIAGHAFSVACKALQFAAKSKQVARNVLRFKTICSNAIQDPRLTLLTSKSSLRSLRFPIPVRTAFAGERRGRGKGLCADEFLSSPSVVIALTNGRAMATSRQAERLRKQRIRQQKYRDRLKAERRPERDDVAQVFLHLMIVKGVGFTL